MRENERIKEAKKIMQNIGVGFFCIDMEDEDLNLLVFRVLPVPVVSAISKILVSMGLCGNYCLRHKNDSYRTKYILDRTEVELYGMDRTPGIQDNLIRLCIETAFAKGYTLYLMSINDLLNLKASEAFDKRKRYI